MRARSVGRAGWRARCPARPARRRPGASRSRVSRAGERPVASRPSATSWSLSISKRLDWPGRGSYTVARPLTSTRATQAALGRLAAGQREGQRGHGDQRGVHAAPAHHEVVDPRLAVEPDAALRVAMAASNAAADRPRGPARPRCRAAGRGWRAWRPCSGGSTRARPCIGGARRTLDTSTDSGAPATVTARRSEPRGSGATVESAAASIASASARQVRGGVSVRSSKRIAPPVRARRSSVSAADPARAACDGRRAGPRC